MAQHLWKYEALSISQKRLHKERNNECCKSKRGIPKANFLIFHMLGGYDKLKCLEKIGQLRSGEDFSVIHFNEQCFIFLALVLQKQSPEIFFERVEIRRVLRLVESKNDLLSRIMSMYFRKPFYSYFL